jgi:hypothetical protein
MKKTVSKTIKKAQNGIRANADNTRVKSPVVKQTKQQADQNKEWPYDLYKNTTIDNPTGRRREMTDKEYSGFAERTIKDFEKKRNYPGSLWEKTKTKEKAISKKRDGGKVTKAKSGGKVVKKSVKKK